MVVTLVVGGATRLTESGLSIVEWRPVTGVVPPLDAAAWQAEFDKYKTIPQYRERNRGMSLDDFKTIYWWEWSHRLLARLVGAAFPAAVPVVPVARLDRAASAAAAVDDLRARRRAWARSAGGWCRPGLTERVNVSQYRLAFHLTLACVIYAMILDRAAACAARAARRCRRRIRASAIGLLVLVLVQIYLGALVAGLRAGLIYNTWPLIDGRLVPDASRLFFQEPLWRNFFENALTVQFDHRMVGLCAVVLRGAACRRCRAQRCGEGRRSPVRSRLRSRSPCRRRSAS